MNIANLEHYVERANDIRAMFKAKPLSLLVAEDRQIIADRLSADMSPENLTMDGEISWAQANKTHKYLLRVADELQSIDPEVFIEGVWD